MIVNASAILRVFFAAYLALTQERGDVLVTGDLRLYPAVRDHPDWVQWIGG